MEHNPWQITGEQNIYDNPWIQLTEYQVIDPSGGKGIYGKIHFKNVAVGVIPIDDENHTWLVGQFRFPLQQYSWEIPEGGAQVGTAPLLSAQRELKEETGLTAGHWEEFLTMHLSNSVADELAIVYLATELQAGTASPEETEQLQVKRVPLETAFSMVAKGEITDAISVAALIKLQVQYKQSKQK
jgi:8-oxo-dGTP pyrophosphatase MutT (NUDIX family)